MDIKAAVVAAIVTTCWCLEHPSSCCEDFYGKWRKHIFLCDKSVSGDSHFTIVFYQQSNNTTYTSADLQYYPLRVTKQFPYCYDEKNSFCLSELCISFFTWLNLFLVSASCKNTGILKLQIDHKHWRQIGATRTHMEAHIRLLKGA